MSGMLRRAIHIWELARVAQAVQGVRDWRNGSICPLDGRPMPFWQDVATPLRWMQGFISTRSLLPT